MRIPVPDERIPADQLGKVHFVGIGGAGLSAIARIMLARGITVSGSDGADSTTLAALRDLGALCYLGHDAQHVGDADTLVVSTAVRADNPEVVEAQRRGLRLLPRSAALDSVMQGRRVIAVAGTHGKTTTTSLLTVALIACGADPSYTIGGDLSISGTNAHDGRGDLFVAEADESDGAFLVYTPDAAIVTNVEADHLDNYGTAEAYAEAFEHFLDRLEPDGFVVLCVDDPGAARLADVADGRGITSVRVGEGADADVRVSNTVLAGSTSSFTVATAERELGRITLQIPGRHYVLDAACAVAVCLRLGFEFEPIRSGLEQFSGTRRRMELKGEAAGVRVYDSYAHHPTEIEGDLTAARSLAGDGRVVTCFQPHMFSRTQIFAEAMGRALGMADRVVVMDVYPAREEPVPGVDGSLVARHVPLDESAVAFEADSAAVPARLAAVAQPGDIVLTLGAGDVTQIGPKLLSLLEDESR